MNDHTENSRFLDRQLGKQRFARKVGLLLNESTNTIPIDRLDRLAAARKAAVQAHAASHAAAIVWGPRAALVAHGSRTFVGGGDSWGELVGRAGLCSAAVFFVGIFLVGVFQAEQHRRIEEFAETEAGVLVDDFPISAYADHGFNAFLQQNQ